MKFILEMECDNEAFEPNARYEISRILQDARKHLEAGHYHKSLFDVNGNRVGQFTLETNK